MLVNPKISSITLGKISFIILLLLAILVCAAGQRAGPPHGGAGPARHQPRSQEPADPDQVAGAPQCCAVLWCREEVDAAYVVSLHDSVTAPPSRRRGEVCTIRVCCDGVRLRVLTTEPNGSAHRVDNSKLTSVRRVGGAVGGAATAAGSLQ